MWEPVPFKTHVKMCSVKCMRFQKKKEIKICWLPMLPDARVDLNWVKSKNNNLLKPHKSNLYFQHFENPKATHSIPSYTINKSKLNVSAKHASICVNYWNSLEKKKKTAHTIILLLQIIQATKKHAQNYSFLFAIFHRKKRLISGTASLSLVTQILSHTRNMLGCKSLKDFFFA